MSKILRRPMFRGGPVNSEGTGITSGLNDGYANGGRVSAATGGWLANLLANLTRTPGSVLPTPSFTGTIPKTGIGGLLQSSEALSSYLPTMSQMGSGALAALPSALALAPVGLFEYGRRHPLEGKEKDIQTTANELQQEYYGQPRKKLMEDIMTGKREEGKTTILPSSMTYPFSDVSVKYKEAKSPYENFNYKAAEEKAKQAVEQYDKPENTTPLTTNKDSIDSIFDNKDDSVKKSTSELTKDDVSAYAKKYAELLGGEKADRQAIFDAMLAASPAFFKGKTLKEAAPNIFEAISKSGAFDKPQKIKQAAAELAIQRELMLEKIKETGAERAKLAGINISGKQSFGKDLLNLTKLYPNHTWQGIIDKPWNQVTDADVQSFPENSLFTVRDPKNPEKKLYAKTISKNIKGKTVKSFGFIGAPGQVTPSDSSTSILSSLIKETE
jgi:hypothetical protein